MPNDALDNNEYTILWQEINEQPDCLETLLKRPQSDFNAFSDEKINQASAIVCLAEGSSLNSLNMVKPWLEGYFNCPVICSDAHQWQGRLQTVTNQQDLLANPLFIILSQSGNTACLLDAVATSKTMLEMNDSQFRQHSTLICNQSGSQLETLTGKTILLNVGKEQSIPATKTVSASVLALLRVAHVKVDDHLPNTLREWFSSTQNTINALAKAVEQCQELVVLAEYPVLPVLDEAKLKMTEMLAIPVHQHNLESFKHGSKMLLGRGVSHQQAVLYVLTHYQSVNQYMADVDSHLLNREQQPWINHPQLHLLQLGGELAAVPQSIQLHTLPALSENAVTALFQSLLMFQQLATYWAQHLNRPLNPPALSKWVAQ